VNGPAGDRWPTARELADRLARQANGSVRVVLLYGSRLLGTNPDPHSALDFVVVVDDYRRFYRGLAEAGELHRPIWLLTALAHVLPPNVIAYAPRDGREGIAKCLVVSEEDLERALGPTPPDHFLLGRLIQRTATVWAASAASNDGAGPANPAGSANANPPDPPNPADQANPVGPVDAAAPAAIRIAALIESAQMRVLDWTAPYLDEPVDAAGLGRRLLEVCYRGELRPESRGRAGRVFDAQADYLARALAPALEAAVADGRMRREGQGYALADGASPAERRRWRRYFRKSKSRTTLRWFKHMLTFANWLPYVVRKVERHTGREIHLTFLERKLPIVFLWPRAVHVLLTRPRRENES